jgi:hypothetical protein
MFALSKFEISSMEKNVSNFQLEPKHPFNTVVIEERNEEGSCFI